MSVDDNFVKFVFVPQWNLWQSPLYKKNILRNVQITDDICGKIKKIQSNFMCNGVSTR